MSEPRVAVGSVDKSGNVTEEETGTQVSLQAGTEATGQEQPLVGGRVTTNESKRRVEDNGQDPDGHLT